MPELFTVPHSYRSRIYDYDYDSPIEREQLLYPALLAAIIILLFSYGIPIPLRDPVYIGNNWPDHQVIHA